MEKRIELRYRGEITVRVGDTGAIFIDGKEVTRNESVIIARTILEAYQESTKRAG